jgi:hypothetical protein
MKKLFITGMIESLGWLLLMFAVLFLASLSGCGHLNPDICTADGKPCLPSIQGNFPTAEFSACGQDRFGLGVCPIKVGAAYDAVNLEIQTYYNGTARVVSENCFVDDGFSYGGSQRVRYRLQGNAGPVCLVSFVVSPTYPRQKRQSLVIHSFKGHLAMIPVAERYGAFYGFTSHVQEGEAVQVQIPVTTEARSIQAKVRGCGINLDPVLTVEDHKAILELRKLRPDLAVQTCIILAELADQDKPTLTAWLVAGYSINFNRLQIPRVTIVKKSLEVEAAAGVSIIALDSDWSIGNHGGFSWDAKTCHTLRLLTIAGRSALGNWCPDRGWSWAR